MISSALSLLAVTGNQIVTVPGGQAIRLRGLNRSGLEYSLRAEGNVLATAGISESELDAISAWGANLIRLPFNQSWVLTTDDYDAEPYLQALDCVVGWASALGMYTLLDLQWIDHLTPRGYLQDGSPNFVPALPDLASLTAWRLLARRYSREPAVLYDLFNEPHDLLAGDPHPLRVIRPDGTLLGVRGRRVKAAAWHPWAKALVAAIRAENPVALIFASGLDWGYDLADFPLASVEGVVYSSHVYPQKKKHWDQAFGNLSRTHPVFVGELGGRDIDLAWGEKLLSYLDERQIGWAAWSWSDNPRLLHPGPGYRPTIFGALVRQSLLNRVRA